VFCPEDIVSHNIDDRDVNVLFPITKAGYTNSSKEVCNVVTSSGKAQTNNITKFIATSCS